MYCYKCAAELDDKALVCEVCEVSVAHVMKPNYYKVSIILGTLLLLTPFYGFLLKLFSPFESFITYSSIIFGVIGLIFAFFSKRTAAFALNIAGIALWV
ncbi:MAG: hypothetical protein FWG44_05845, partial [Oscillospiraceae bacterium]|nr:hypothetical protein [Oscillospiraceae bacterium]